MGVFVNPDNSEFQTVVNSNIYIDKTGLLKYTNEVMNTLQGYICSSSPERFGKSIIASMLAAYYSKGCNSEGLFSKLKIGGETDWKKYLNQYNIIYLDLQWCIESAGGPNEVVPYISKNVIKELKDIYPTISEVNPISVPEMLLRIHAATGEKFIVIIDDWDILFRTENADVNIREKYINFLRGMFHGTMSTRYLQLAYLTGILPIAKGQVQSVLSNFMSYSILNPGPLEAYNRFTKDDVEQLCSKFQRSDNEVNKWYGGYWTRNGYIYDPNSVVRFIFDGELRSYWLGGELCTAIISLINMDFDGVREQLSKMVKGECVTVENLEFRDIVTGFASRDNILTYLIHLGYLTYDWNSKKAFIPE